VPQPTTVIYFPYMAAKKTNKKRKASLDAILSTVERGFAAVADDIAEIKSKMATKDDIADVKSTLADHTKILNNHTPDLAVIKNDVTTNLDKRLQLAVRVSAIEKHLAVRQVRHQPRQKRPYTRRPYLATRSQTNGCGAWSRATNCPTPENVGG
jgi:hypothetical protein